MISSEGNSLRGNPCVTAPKTLPHRLLFFLQQRPSSCHNPMDAIWNEPKVILYSVHDHRYVEVEELKNISVYNSIMNRPRSSILDYALTKKKHFLKPTSGWNEFHLIAFRCLVLDNLPISRILPEADLPRDDDPTMQLVFKYLSDSEEDVRNGKALSFSPALSFYRLIQVVISRSPDPIPIPRTLRPGTSTTFPSIPESMSQMNPGKVWKAVDLSTQTVASTKISSRQ
jgi:hypothetical protein